MQLPQIWHPDNLAQTFILTFLRQPPANRISWFPTVFGEGLWFVVVDCGRCQASFRLSTLRLDCWDFGISLGFPNNPVLLKRCVLQGFRAQVRVAICHLAILLHVHLGARGQSRRHVSSSVRTNVAGNSAFPRITCVPLMSNTSEDWQRPHNTKLP